MMDTPISMRSLQRCVSFCTAGSYDILALAHFLKKKGFVTHVSRDVLHVTNNKRGGDVFFFNHGCMVAWGFTKHFEDKLLEFVKDVSVNPLMTIEIDQFHYHYGDQTTVNTHEQLRVDIVTLESEDSQIKLGISYALAQSIKLEAFEETIKDAIKKNSALPEEIASWGTVSLSHNAIFKRMGEIFITRSSINLNMEYLDAPEFFWRNPSLEPYYIMMKKFLDIPSRVMALNQKLDVLQELLDILNSQVQHRNSSFLEAIIIVLISVEIIISLFQFHLV